MAALGQTAAPQFEVASIKPAAGAESATIRPLPGRLTAKASLRTLMQGAYDLQSFQIVGGPEWIGSQQYEIDARAAADSNSAQMLVMLRSLLEDRFQLRVHRESREMPVFALLAARGGLKLPTARDGSCVDDAELLGPLAEPGARLEPPDQSAPAAAPRCGRLNITLEPRGARLRGSKVPMAEFARMLTRVLGRTVTDQTGFSGVFDVNLDFLPDDATVGLPPPPPGAIPFATASSSIFGSIQELGLRLDSTKAPVEVLVIDHVEPPSAN
jgi:uncharacterized protein (TIGR03435 family)